jgi:hypothetical protein
MKGKAKGIVLGPDLVDCHACDGRARLVDRRNDESGDSP